MQLFIQQAASPLSFNLIIHLIVVGRLQYGQNMACTYENYSCKSILAQDFLDNEKIAFTDKEAA
ncbi:MAG: hypothetical protein Q8906_07070 [Bacillota bacterium]|nr:hypothetical protein [Bacillota bacterium]